MLLVVVYRKLRCRLGIHRNNYQATITNLKSIIRYCPDCRTEIFLGLAYSVEIDGIKQGLGHIALLETLGYKVIGDRTPFINQY